MKNKKLTTVFIQKPNREKTRFLMWEHSLDGKRHLGTYFLEEKMVYIYTEEEHQKAIEALNKTN